MCFVLQVFPSSVKGYPRWWIPQWWGIGNFTGGNVCVQRIWSEKNGTGAVTTAKNKVFIVVNDLKIVI